MVQKSDPGGVKQPQGGINYDIIESVVLSKRIKKSEGRIAI
jgi:hypothetical protein